MNATFEYLLIDRWRDHMGRIEKEANPERFRSLGCKHEYRSPFRGRHFAGDPITKHFQPQIMRVAVIQPIGGSLMRYVNLVSPVKGGHEQVAIVPHPRTGLVGQPDPP